MEGISNFIPSTPLLASSSNENEKTSSLVEREVTLGVNDLYNQLQGLFELASIHDKYDKSKLYERVIRLWITAEMDPNYKIKGCVLFDVSMTKNETRLWNHENLKKFNELIYSEKAVIYYEDHLARTTREYMCNRPLFAGKYPDMTPCHDAYFKLCAHSKNEETLAIARTNIFKCIATEAINHFYGPWFNYHQRLANDGVDLTELNLLIIEHIQYDKWRWRRDPNKWYAIWKSVEQREDLRERLEKICYKCCQYKPEAFMDVDRARYLAKGTNDEYVKKAKIYLLRGLDETNKDVEIEERYMCVTALLDDSECVQACAVFYINLFENLIRPPCVHNILENFKNKETKPLFEKALAELLIKKLHQLVKQYEPKGDRVDFYVRKLASIPEYEVNAFLLQMEYIEKVVKNDMYISIKNEECFEDLWEQLSKKDKNDLRIQTLASLMKIIKEIDGVMENGMKRIIKCLFLVIDSEKTAQAIYNKNKVLQNNVFFSLMAIARYENLFSTEVEAFLQQLKASIKAIKSFYLCWLADFMESVLEEIKNTNLLNQIIEVVLPNIQRYDYRLMIVQKILSRKDSLKLKLITNTLKEIQDPGVFDSIESHLSSTPPYESENIDNLKEQAGRLLRELSVND